MKRTWPSGLDDVPGTGECRPPQCGSWMLCDLILGGLICAIEF
jgi:hypothetical protein